MKAFLIAPALAALTLGACGTLVEEPATEVYEAALEADYRSPQDLENDAARMPVETLSFMGIKPGDSVVELEAGGGYFTAILAETVGPTGQVWMQNPAVFDQFWGGGDHPRMETLPGQVIYLRSDFDNLSVVQTETVDVVTWIQGPHELWYIPEGATEPLGHPDKTFKEIARVLKPGGSLIVQDHRAPDGLTGINWRRYAPD